jgi:organic hydroperoxide reductase OsmC/OhrA
LERVDGVTQFTRYTAFATLKVSSESDAARARRLLEKAEHACLISNSGTGPKNKRLALLQAVELLVAGTGFEPVTFGL